MVIVEGKIIEQGTVSSVRGTMSLEQKFKHIIQAEETGGLSWLHGLQNSA